jgi:hypothetical protein
MGEFLDQLVAERHTPQQPQLPRPVWGGQAGLRMAVAEIEAHEKTKREKAA